MKEEKLECHETTTKNKTKRMKPDGFMYWKENFKEIKITLTIISNCKGIISSDK